MQTYYTHFAPADQLALSSKCNIQHMCAQVPIEPGENTNLVLFAVESSDGHADQACWNVMVLFLELLSRSRGVVLARPFSKCGISCQEKGSPRTGY